jgi:type IV pilus assembly protein PilW
VNTDHKQSTFKQAGFSLIEIMVGLVIGLLVTLVIMQVFSVFEGQKRTTTGTSDAQTNGSIALFTIQRELQMAGYGLLPVGQANIADSAIDCLAPTVDAALTIGGLAPITITDGGTAGGSDSITIRYGTTDGGGIPTTIGSMAGNVAGLADSAGNPMSNMACNVGDIALIMNGNACNLTSVTALSAASVVPPTITLNSSAGAVPGANLACLGTWREILYSVSNGNLMRNATPSDASQAVATVADIVNIQAQYGIGDPTATNPNRIVQWVDATGGTWAAPSLANRNRIKAVRVAVVARNGLLEKTNVTNAYNGKACSSLTSDTPLGVCAWSATSLLPDLSSPAPAIDLSSDANWQRYRYRVFETVIPLRNMIWAKGTL